MDVGRARGRCMCSRRRYGGEEAQKARLQLIEFIRRRGTERRMGLPRNGELEGGQRRRARSDRRNEQRAGA